MRTARTQPEITGHWPCHARNRNPPSLHERDDDHGVPCHDRLCRATSDKGAVHNEEQFTMQARRKRFTRSAGVTLEVPVLNYLRNLAEKDDRDRSFCINQIVREHAARNGNPLPPANEPPAPEPEATLPEER